MAQGSGNTSTTASLVVKPHLLIVDDDRELCQLISRYLDDKGFLSTAVDTGIAGEKTAIVGDFQLIVLDVMLPTGRGSMYCANSGSRSAPYLC
jgi:DNA-binding response OmpR family regulator